MIERKTSLASPLVAALFLLVSLGACTRETTPPVTPLPTLDEETLDRLVLSLGALNPTIELHPGSAHTLTLGVVECCYIFEPVEAQATWSVSPSEGAGIDPATGVLTIDPATPHGSIFTVSADVEKGRRIVSINVHVYTPEGNPLVALWSEQAQLTCESGEEIVPETLIGELRFLADGSFNVTWQPFEVYVDYWGTYTYDLEQGTLTLTITGGNYVPEGVDPTGSFSFDGEGRLILEDMWLGSPHWETLPVNCGHVFR